MKRKFLLNHSIRATLLTTLFGIVTLQGASASASASNFKSPLADGAVKPYAAVTITGKVTDENGVGVPGATVMVKGTSIAAAADFNGNYKITAPDANSTLVFSFLGYVSAEVAINGQTVINVQLKADTKSLNEVVVVGYGTQKRAAVTGAISTVSGKTLAQLPVAGIDQALQGRVAGLTVTNNGSPGSAPIVSIRGNSSISFGSDPLYIVDGFPGSIGGIDPKDIQSLEVLKDASAAAIYGSRATNGVVIVTTKKGAAGKVQIDFDSYVGVQSITKRFDLLNTDQYLQYERALNSPSAVPPRLEPANFNKPIYEGASQTFAQTNTDWQDAYFKNNQLLQQHSVAISGGNDNSHFYTSAGYFAQNGIAQGLDFNRKNFRMNSDHKIRSFLTFGETFNASVTHQRLDVPGGNRTPITNVIRMLPYIPVYNPNNAGGFQGPLNSFDGSDPTNPVEGALINENYNNGFNIRGNAFMTLKFTDWLKFTSTYGLDYGTNLNEQYTPIYNDGGTSSSPTATISKGRSSGTTTLYSQQLAFDKTFAKHHVSGVAVYESQGTNNSSQSSSGNQSTNAVKTLQGATNLFTNYTTDRTLLVSMVGRLAYDFDSKYFISGSIRRDGLSVWAPGHKYQNFPAVSAGWKVDRESFLKDVTAITELKLRGGYGVTGVNGTALGPYPYLQAISSNQATYPFNGSLSDLGNASFYNGLTNLSLAWETTKQTNIGVDLGLFDNKVTVSAELYKRKMDRLIINVPTPLSFGFGGAGTVANVASLENKGFELTVGYHQNKGDFKWDVTGLFSLVRNKVLELNSPNASITAGGDADFGGGGPITNTIAGQSIQSFYGYVVEGIFQNAGEITAHATQPGAQPGDIKFKDLNGDKIINDADRTFIGSYLPKFTYSLNYSASYKNFDVSIFFQGVQGNKIFNAERIILEGMPRLFNAGTNVLKAWTPTNTNTDIPRAAKGDPNGNVRPSTRWIEDGSYLRLKNAIIGYNVPSTWLKSKTNNSLSRLRLYVSSQNLLTFTKYSGLDPEVGSKNGTLTNGIDYGQYPQPRSFQFGIQATF
ncbi:SusC/RagA family TonB-linked outer membrane protein [Mucilaginibacter psychrotolerans]|uniref:TonB-dependent receptor n=1 Tax=Mucilaginibacter psychrotolerans TaxID=1524096 RepID=A0A4Y8SG68_9SPHI|nr:TonB-dependent receptor [Mucilaginibacter psychrotolerans]TFF37537.1 TonB-dependent receptor [Mucilaginibacter psychrotolerans]